MRLAEQTRCSKAEIIRRALRAYLGIEDCRRASPGKGSYEPK